MPSFGSPFSGFASEHILTHEELIRAVRFLVASEYEATQLYTQLADSINHHRRLFTPKFHQKGGLRRHLECVAV
jgi:hypothetical protein